MFFVINKEKIYAYLISIMTVVLLFYVASVSISSSGKVIETAAGIDRLLPIYRVDTQEKKVALTLNCAWNAEDIDSILATLQKQEVKVTFFMVGDWINKFPEEVKKIHEAGHEIGSHSDTHPHVNQLSYEKNQEEIEKSNDKIEKLIGTRTTLYRPPYGEYNNTVIQAARDKGYYPIQWSLDTLDYTGLTGNEMWSRLNDKLKGGDIILMHNGAKHTADSLEMILQNIKAAGYQVTTVSDLIYQQGYTIDVNGTQVKHK